MLLGFVPGLMETSVAQHVIDLALNGTDYLINAVAEQQREINLLHLRHKTVQRLGRWHKGVDTHSPPKKISRLLASTLTMRPTFYFRDVCRYIFGHSHTLTQLHSLLTNFSCHNCACQTATIPQISSLLTRFKH